MSDVQSVPNVDSKPAFRGMSAMLASSEALGLLVALPGNCNAAMSASSQNDLAEILRTYNALPDTRNPLAIAQAADNGVADPNALPEWVSDLSVTRQEMAALVALAGAYSEQPSTAPRSKVRNFNLLEWLAGLAVMAETDEILTKANGVAPSHDAAPISRPPRPNVLPSPSEIFIRKLAALGSCPGAFASLALTLHLNHPDSGLDQWARRARTDRVDLATRPDPNCKLMSVEP